MHQECRASNMGGDTSPLRLIDTLPSIGRPSTFPMRVLFLSPARSGTTSVERALQYLGFKVYQGMKHAFLHAKRGENTYPHWSEALDAKYPLSTPSNTRYGAATPFATKDFEKILGRYDAVVGWPASCFVDEMLTAYPHAKIILMSRPTSSWSNSIRRSLIPWLTWWSWKVLLPLENGFVRDCIRCGQRCVNVWTDGKPWDRETLERKFEEHNDYVKKVVSKERLLVYRVEEGWEPLCEFLEMKVPEEPYPREAVGGQFQKQGNIFWTMALVKVTAKALVLISLQCAIYWAMKRFSSLVR